MPLRFRLPAVIRARVLCLLALLILSGVAEAAHLHPSGSSDSECALCLQSGAQASPGTGIGLPGTGHGYSVIIFTLIPTPAAPVAAADPIRAPPAPLHF